ncbi:GlsB/YeaQ/YmgE family stress response membrane protein [bacterium]|nr:MAG: GlsB/YeaQ/YmgE family stress response membrane protein [bacterium]
MGSIIYWIIVGLIAGVLAKAIMPGSDREPKGCIMTILLGIAGSVIMGFIMQALLGGGSGGFIGTIIGATIGAIILILAFRKFWK